MGFFTKKVVKEIRGGAWGHLVGEHGVDVDTLYSTMRCVEREGVLDGTKVPVTFMRVFKPSEADKKGVVIAGWETFDEHPDLVLFEGYVTKGNQARLQRKKT